MTGTNTTKLNSNALKRKICDHVKANRNQIDPLADQRFWDAVNRPNSAAKADWLWCPTDWKRCFVGKDNAGRKLRIFDHDQAWLHCVVRTDPDDQQVLALEFYSGSVSLWGKLMDPTTADKYK